MTMQRARRLATVAVVAAVAVTGLSACRSEPDVAAYTAAGKITVARVQTIYDDARSKHARDVAKAAAQAKQNGLNGTAPAAKLALTDANVLDTVFSHDVLMRIAAKHNVQIPSPLPLADYANLLKLPADSQYVKLFVEVEGLQYVLNQAVQGGALTAADTKEIFDRIKAQNALQPGETLAQFTASLGDDAKKALGSAVALRDEVKADVAAQHVRLNPRYPAFDVPVLTQRGQDGSALILVAAPVGAKTDTAPVRDLS
jgi:hypothetical protein